MMTQPMGKVCAGPKLCNTSSAPRHNIFHNSKCDNARDCMPLHLHSLWLSSRAALLQLDNVWVMLAGCNQPVNKYHVCIYDIFTEDFWSGIH
jgi:hypothetical protein